MAAMAIQKSNRCTRKRRRIAGKSIIPNTTASMITTANTAFGKSENSGARNSIVNTTKSPVTNEDICVLAPD